MKRYLYAVIITCLGAILIGLNTKEHNPPIPEAVQPETSHVEAVQEPIEPVSVPEPIQAVETIVEAPSEPVEQPPVVETIPPPPPMSNQNGRCGDNDYAHAIYMGESSCVMDVINSIGACGLGQSLPCDKMAKDCPDWRTNYDCQNAWFTAYAMSYGSWENAYNFKFCVGYCYSTRTNTTEYKSATNLWW